MTTIPDTSADTRRLVRELAARTLTGRQLDVWRLRHGANPLTIRHAALVLNVSERTIRTHEARALQKLLDALETELSPRG